MTEEEEIVYDNIRFYRNKKGISILKLSNETGISRSHLYYIESKKISPTIETLNKIAIALEIPLKDFFTKA